MYSKAVYHVKSQRLCPVSQKDVTRMMIMTTTRIHTIRLGLSMMSLEEEMILHLEKVDAVDGLERTSLG